MWENPSLESNFGSLSLISEINCGPSKIIPVISCTNVAPFLIFTYASSAENTPPDNLCLIHNKSYLFSLFSISFFYGTIMAIVMIKKHHIKRLKPRKASHFFLYLFAGTVFLIVVLSLELTYILANYANKLEKFIARENQKVAYYSPLPSSTPTPSPFEIRFQRKINLGAEQPGQWGVARQINEHTWTMKVGEDARMTTAQELYDALNSYRKMSGVGYLTWDDNLAKFAQTRAETFSLLGRLDEHQGFMDYVKDEANLRKLGFWGVGENSSSGYRMLGVHLIEWIYAADKPHNDNQIDPSWTHVGVGVSGTATDIIFGNNKM